MSKKHVEDYFYKMVSDYTEMKQVLEELQTNMSEDKVAEATASIKRIKEQVRLLETNYKRLSYIMYLLNMPNKKEKQASYIRREQSKLKNISSKDMKSGVSKENTAILNELKAYK